MEKQPSLKIDIPGVDFGALAREAIAAKFAESMLGADDAIKKIVLSAMSSKVNDRGITSQYSYENKQSYMEWLATDLIQQAALDVLKTKVDELRPVLEECIEAALKRDITSVANALTESFIQQAKGSYGIKVDVSAKFSNPNT